MTEISNDQLVLELKRGFPERLSSREALSWIELQLRVTAKHYYWFKREGNSILTVLRKKREFGCVDTETLLGHFDLRSNNHSGLIYLEFDVALQNVCY